MTTLIDQVVNAFVAVVATTPEATGGVYEDRAQAFTIDQNKAIDITLREADGRAFGDDSPVRSVLATVLQVELAIYTRTAINSGGVEPSARALSAPIWASAHGRLMADPSLGGLASRIRWKRASWRRENADGNASWTSHTYEITLAMREHNLLAPL